MLKILTFEGVKGYRNARFWSHAPSVLTGSIHVQATDDANEQQVIRQVNQLFMSLGFTHFTTQLEKDEFVARKSFSSEYEMFGMSDENSTNQTSRILLENSALEGFGSESMYSGGGGLQQVEVVGSSDGANDMGTDHGNVSYT